MNPQIIQPSNDAMRSAPAQPVARPITYAQQPTAYQPKSLLPNQVARQSAAAPVASTVSRPIAAVVTRQRAVISGNDDEDKLLTHGKIILGQQVK